MTIIRNAFKDNRQVTPIDDTLHLFRAEDGEIIYLDLQLEDFTIEELLKYVEKAENLYKEYDSKVNLCIICPSHIKMLVKEFPIKSDADFSIKVACTDLNPYKMVLDIIKKKVNNNVPLDIDDRKALELLPMVCPPSEQHEIRKEVFKILNTI